MKNTFPSARAKLPLAIGLFSVLFLVGCGPTVEDSALVETNGTTASTTTSFLASAKAVVSQREVATTAECTNGGVEIQAGNDTNGNAILDSNEVVRQWVVCHGTNGTNGQDGAAGQSTHFEVNSVAAGDTCPAGGQTIKIGIKEGEGFKAGSPTQSFNICNGAKGEGVSLTAKIAQGKALVKNTSEHLNNLVNEGVYDSYMDSVEAIFSDKNTTGLYGVLGDVIAAAVDVLNGAAADDKAALTIFLKGRGYSDADLANLTAIRSGTQLTVTGLTSAVQGVTFASLILEHSTRVDEGDDSVEKWVIRDYKVTNSTHSLNPSINALSFVELRLAKGALSSQQMAAAAESGNWDENSYRINANSKLVIDLSGVALSTLDGTTRFTGGMDFKTDLHKGKFDSRLPAFDFNQAHLTGSLLHKGKVFNMDLAVSWAPKKNGLLDPTAKTFKQRSDIETKLAQFQSALTASGVPIVFDTFDRDGKTVERLTVDYANLLTQFESNLRFNADDSFGIEGIDKVVVEAVKKPGENNSYMDVTKIAFEDGKVVERYTSNASWISSDVPQLLASWVSSSVELTAVIYGFEVEVSANFDKYAVTATSSTLPLSTGSWAFDSRVNEAHVPIDIKEITAKIDSDVDGVFDVTLSLKNIQEMDYEYYREAAADTSLLFKHNSGVIQANFTLLHTLDIVCYPNDQSTKNTIYDSGFYTCNDGKETGVKRDKSLSISFTDLQGAKFVVQFQNRAWDEQFNAYVTVDGINVGKLVHLRNGDYAVEFTDYERVTLINN